MLPPMLVLALIPTSISDISKEQGLARAFQAVAGVARKLPILQRALRALASGDQFRRLPKMIGNRIATDFACILRPGDNTGKRLPAAIAKQLCQLAGAPILGAGRIFSLDRIERRRLWVIRCALIVTL